MFNCLSANKCILYFIEWISAQIPKNSLMVQDDSIFKQIYKFITIHIPMANRITSIFQSLVEFCRSYLNLTKRNPPPNPDSPQNILNALNDHCIQEILLRLNDINDFMNAAKVCTRFEINAIICFPTKFTIIYIDSQDEPSNNLSMKQLPSFLSTFGQHVQSIVWGYPKKLDFRNTDRIIQSVDEILLEESDQKIDEDTLNMIADYCRYSLVEFEMNGHYANLNILSRFKSLEKLKLRLVFLRGHGPLPALKWLNLTYFKAENYGWLAQIFPNLLTAEFSGVCALTSDIFIEFQRLNPKLRDLVVNECDDMDQTIYDNIAERTPNLERLSIPSNFNSDKRYSIYGIRPCPFVSISNLHKLKILRLPFGSDYDFDRLYDEIVANCLPVETLEINYSKTYYFEILKEIKTIKNLRFMYDINVDMLNNIVRELPHLENLFAIIYHFEIDKILKILQNGKKISYLFIAIIDYNLSVDLNIYHSILALVENRIKTRIFIQYNPLIQVPNEILEANKKWLKIEGFDDSKFDRIYPWHCDRNWSDDNLAL